MYGCSGLVVVQARVFAPSFGSFAEWYRRSAVQGDLYRPAEGLRVGSNGPLPTCSASTTASKSHR
jgi:hypothetical protein